MSGCYRWILFVQSNRYTSAITGYLLPLQFEFKKIEEIIHIYKETREKVDELFLFQSTYARGISLGSEYRIEERWSQSCEQQMDWNIPSWWAFLQKQIRYT